MNKVTIKTCIDASNPEHLSAMNVFLEAINGQGTQQVSGAPVVAIQVKEEPVVDPKPKRKSRAKKVDVAEDAAEQVKKEADAKEVAEATAETKKIVDAANELEAQKENAGVAEKVTTPAESTVTIEEVRALLSKKVGEHRAAIKAMLSDLGAPNVSSLKVGDYKTMFDFLTELS
jgi:hypothetical protein